ncbi:hypothetical protein HI914_01249 [Erysiphe necator]|nr:hypothetical protein HI914_01249 [Erysiphe necator]
MLWSQSGPEDLLVDAFECQAIFTFRRCTSQGPHLPRLRSYYFRWVLLIVPFKTFSVTLGSEEYGGQSTIELSLLSLAPLGLSCGGVLPCIISSKALSLMEAISFVKTMILRE